MNERGPVGRRGWEHDRRERDGIESNILRYIDIGGLIRLYRPRMG